MEDVPERHLLEEIDFCPDLSESNKKALQEVVLNHKDEIGRASCRERVSPRWDYKASVRVAR